MNLKLRNILLSLAWVSIAFAVHRNYSHLNYQQSLIAQEGVWQYVTPSPAVSWWASVTLACVAVLTTFGQLRASLWLGVPTLLIAVYQLIQTE